VSPLRGEKPQNRPLSKFNTGRFALRAMLPVMSSRFGTSPRRTIHLTGHLPGVATPVGTCAAKGLIRRQSTKKKHPSISQPM